MGALLGTNDSKNVVIAVTPPTGPAGVALGALVLALLPGELGITFPFTITGKMSGQFASAQRSVAQTAYTAGADGKVNRTVSHDKSGTFVLTLMQNAPSVSLLTAMVRYESLNRVPVIFNMTITDIDNGAKYDGKQCSVAGYANRTFSSDAAASLEFTILVAELEMIEITLPVFPG
jgi:hypothetical protein